jgi:hypothetical protein
MWQQEFTWFFALFHHEFQKGSRLAFEVLMALAFAHFFGFYNPKQLAGGSTLNRGYEHQRLIRRCNAREGRPRCFGGTQRGSGT